MIKMIENFFLKRHIKVLGLDWKRPVQMSNIFKDVKNVVILWNEDLDSLKNILSFDQTIKNKLNGAVITYLINPYYNLYKDLFDLKFYNYQIPESISFNQFYELKNLKNSLKNIDLYFDFSRIDFMYRKFILRVLKPTVSISFYDERIEEDFTILFKDTSYETLNLLKLLNFKIIEKDFTQHLKESLKKIEKKDVSNILIGKSRNVLNERKKLLKKNEKFLHIQNLEDELTPSSFKMIMKGNVLHFAKRYEEDISFIKNFQNLVD